MFFQESVPKKGAVPGAAVAIQSFGDFLGFNPHLHILGTDGGFYGNGMFRVAPRFETKHLEEIFRHKVFKMLLSRGKITQDLVSMLLSWRHSGFNVFCGPRIQPGDQQAMENLARYTCLPIFVADYPCIPARSCLYASFKLPILRSIDNSWPWRCTLLLAMAGGFLPREDDIHQGDGHGD